MPLDIVRLVFDFLTAARNNNNNGGEEEKEEKEEKREETRAKQAAVFLRVGARNLKSVAESTLALVSPKTRAAVMYDRHGSSISMTLADSIGILPLDTVVRSFKDGRGYVHLNMADVVSSLGEIE